FLVFFILFVVVVLIVLIVTVFVVAGDLIGRVGVGKEEFFRLVASRASLVNVECNSRYRLAEKVTLFAHPDAFDGIFAHGHNRHGLAARFQSDDLAGCELHGLLPESNLSSADNIRRATEKRTVRAVAAIGPHYRVLAARPSERAGSLGVAIMAT